MNENGKKIKNMCILFVRWMISDGFVRQSKRALSGCLHFKCFALPEILRALNKFNNESIVEVRLPSLNSVLHPGGEVVYDVDRLPRANAASVGAHVRHVGRHPAGHSREEDGGRGVQSGRNAEGHERVSAIQMLRRVAHGAVRLKHVPVFNSLLSTFI